VLTERHEKLPGYQGECEFDDALIEQLDVLPEFVTACGFANTKAPGFGSAVQRRRLSGTRTAGQCS
jgi:hypothetical protein